MNFIEKFPVEKLKTADYNPRIIAKNSLNRLKESILTLGMIKPIIINGKNNMMISGHQRAKLLKDAGIKYVPVLVLDDLKQSEEIRFNLFHNSIETNYSKVWLDNIESKSFGFNIIKPAEINFFKNECPLIVKEIGKLVLRYGSWGSVICNESGKVIANSEYAICAKLLNMPLLVYKVKYSQADEVDDFINSSYGRYYFDNLEIKDYQQTFCQMAKNGAQKLRSELYEKYVIPHIDKSKRILDFGAGRCYYPNYLKDLGYKMFMYEPYYRVNGNKSFDLERVISDINEINDDIKQNGLYDVIVLESVLNSVTSMEMQHNVLLTVNSLLKDDGKLIIGTRSYGDATRYYRHKTSTSQRREIEFMDDNNFSATLNFGVWTKQRFATRESLYKELKPYFHNVEIYGTGNRGNLYAVCRSPVRWEKRDYRRVLNIEFNMEYPDGYRHNKHKDLVATVLDERLKVEG